MNKCFGLPKLLVELLSRKEPSNRFIPTACSSRQYMYMVVTIKQYYTFILHDHRIPVIPSERPVANQVSSFLRLPLMPRQLREMQFFRSIRCVACIRLSFDMLWDWNDSRRRYQQSLELIFEFSHCHQPFFLIDSQACQNTVGVGTQYDNTAIHFRVNS